MLWCGPLWPLCESWLQTRCFLSSPWPGQRITHDNAPHKYTRSHQDPSVSLMTQCTFLLPGSGIGESPSVLALTSRPLTSHITSFKSLFICPATGEMSPPTPSPSLSPSSDRSEVSEPPVATHCEFHLCVNKFWLVELLLPPSRLCADLTHTEAADCGPARLPPAHTHTDTGCQHTWSPTSW